MEKRGSLKKIARLVGLLGLKEGYITSKNTLGMIVHPFKTINEIKKEKNYSQAIIIPSVFSIPFALVVFISGLYLVLKYLLKISFPTIVSTGLRTLLFIAFAYIIFVFLYLGYWSIKVKKHE